MRIRNVVAALFVGLTLALAVPAAAHAVGADPRIDIDVSQSGGAVTIHGYDLVNVTGSFTMGGEG